VGKYFPEFIYLCEEFNRSMFRMVPKGIMLRSAVQELLSGFIPIYKSIVHVGCCRFVGSPDDITQEFIPDIPYLTSVPFCNFSIF